MNYKFSYFESITFSIAFMFFTIIGTLSHEYGHILVAKYYGYKTELHYASMNYINPNDNKLAEIYLRNKSSILNKKKYPEEKIFKKLAEQNNINDVSITIGGPFQTILMGTIGFLTLFFRRKKIKENKIKFLDWMSVFLSLFWLREVFNLTMSITSSVLQGGKNYFGGDEKNIAILLKIPLGSIAISLAIIGLVVSFFIIFKIIPKENRFNFILRGLFGGIIGYILWLYLIGPIVLP